MKKLFLSLVLILSCNCFAQSQIWPFTPMNRFGNATYIDFDKEGLSKIEGNRIQLEKTITNRFFDPLIKKDSLRIQTKEDYQTLQQDKRDEPSHKKTFLFYKRRKLENKNIKITYLKLLEFNSTQIIAEATIIDKVNKTKSKEVIRFNPKDLKGVFLGPAEKTRTLVPIISLAGVLLLVFLK